MAFELTPERHMMLRHQARCAECLAWLPPLPTRSEPDDVAGDAERFAGWTHVWQCAVCGHERMVAGGPVVTFDPDAAVMEAGVPIIRDPAQWPGSRRVTDERVAAVIRAAWQYVDAIGNARWIAQVWFYWDLREALAGYDVDGVLLRAAQCVEQVRDATSVPRERVTPAWENLKRALKAVEREDS